VTGIGLFLSLFGMLIPKLAFLHWSADPSSTSGTLAREIAHFTLAIVILLLVRFGERRPLRSLGIGTTPWWKTLLWGLATFAVCMVVAVALAQLTRYNGGAAGKAFEKLPTWLMTLTVLRAGIVEEICYRGYAMTRLEELTGSKVVAFVVPLVVFGLGHWTGGWANILIAVALGGILAGFFLWRRDLVANMTGHFLVDFTANVLPRLVK
jgi:membrane protease YdiL (CAAX protease family)